MREWRRCQRAGMPLSLLMIDVDHFKPYNDHLGHQQGDECLRQVAQLLVEGSRAARRSGRALRRRGIPLPAAGYRHGRCAGGRQQALRGGAAGGYPSSRARRPARG